MPLKPAVKELIERSAERPLCIAHRGASGHRLENTLEAFVFAARLNADLWEIDVHLTADGVCVISHDDSLMNTAGVDVLISTLTLAELQEYRLHNGETVPTLEQVIELAKATDSGLYIELKGEGSGPVAVKQLKQLEFTNASIGSFIAPWVAELAQQECPYPLSVLVPLNADPFAMAEQAQADIIHLCWEKASDTPHTLLTDELLATAKERQLPVVIWHEERPDEVAKLLAMPVTGICSDLPELISQHQPVKQRPLEIICHRGACQVAPENTLASAEIAFRAGAIVELDLHTSADGELMVIHDYNADRTTNLKGPVRQLTSEQLQQCDAGSWFDKQYRQQCVSHFRDYLKLAIKHDSKLYVELKQADPHQVIREVMAMNALDRCFFWSFTRDYIDEIQQYPRAHLMKRREDYASLDELLASGAPYVVEYNTQLCDAAEFAQCRAHGVRVMICSFTTDLDEVKAIIEQQPDMVNIDSLFPFLRIYQQKQRSSQF